MLLWALCMLTCSPKSFILAHYAVAVRNGHNMFITLTPCPNIVNILQLQLTVAANLVAVGPVHVYMQSTVIHVSSLCCCCKEWS